ncbi:MAG: YbhN family protein [Vulcanimicrobiota bacterium]
MKSKISTLLRGVVGVLIAAYLIHLVVARGQVDLLAEVKQANLGLLVLAFSLFGLGTLIGTYRWQLLLRVIGKELNLATLFRLNMIASFFALAIPGGVGGDITKIYYLSREEDKATEAIMTIVLDRLMGLLGLLTVATISVWSAGDLLASGPSQLRLAAGVVATAGVGGLLFVATFYLGPLLVRIDLFKRAGQDVLQRLPESISKRSEAVLSALELCRTRPAVMLAGLLLSTVLHSTIATGVYTIGVASHTEGPRVQDYFLATMVANTVACIPLTPGGLGGRDLVLSLFLEAAGAGKAKAGFVPVVVSLIFIGWGLVGCGCFIFERRVNPAAMGLVTEPES